MNKISTYSFKKKSCTDDIQRFYQKTIHPIVQEIIPEGNLLSSNNTRRQNSESCMRIVLKDKKTDDLLKHTETLYYIILGQGISLEEGFQEINNEIQTLFKDLEIPKSLLLNINHTAYERIQLREIKVLHTLSIVPQSKWLDPLYYCLLSPNEHYERMRLGHIPGKKDVSAGFYKCMQTIIGESFAYNNDTPSTICKAIANDYYQNMYEIDTNNGALTTFKETVLDQMVDHFMRRMHAILCDNPFLSGTVEWIAYVLWKFMDSEKDMPLALLLTNALLRRYGHPLFSFNDISETENPKITSTEDALTIILNGQKLLTNEFYLIPKRFQNIKNPFCDVEFQFKHEY
ncbi:MAG: hypothetical protein COZ46_00270 [Verrucomicrobia bacterium CG_4_10_14_3_um_filter_43_23]|nr:MAG: hypothetical protein AUJ82_04670 [Verrucomicrobia bacterium CG1_02_43_26]PIP59014.1 MAG: hypothetical protein COX01_05540 [Verrucomicrobia bacterium CG22_combo_CG10-13_8_21_14_all_43_17]PIX59111.1 MAG: hypothetical protein COZ46_00270 [Verrucomicrobia bacterium CG_4_10_14_3_um_filter_43_23]PIY61367.1 MAG: hypothetical protein COY94_05840 [Verrucomicrobia bacterium CG_4_10_14_0_8_um_filter_43_34]PJA44149.1 MAG: hypothetical protein CO175_04555 [Verrucomicrobia bacterium CG_4_9_14_3_um_fi